MKNFEEERRRLLVRMLSLGLFSGAARPASPAGLFGAPPSRLPAGKSIYRLKGQVSVDGAPANMDTRIAGGSRISTGPRSELIYVVGESAYIARENTRIVVEAEEGAGAFVSALRLLEGKLLAVFPSKRPVQLSTQTATIGIRGTGVYLESDPELTYFCTCYGVTDVTAVDDPGSRLTVAARQHDEPVYIDAKAPAGRKIRSAPLVNHSDQELMLVETLVGREPPFVFPNANYVSQRRMY